MITLFRGTDPDVLCSCPHPKDRVDNWDTAREYVFQDIRCYVNSLLCVLEGTGPKMEEAEGG